MSTIINCIIIEDERPASEILQQYVSRVSFLQLKGVFTNATQALTLINEGKVELIFLDINLPGISGLDFMRMLNPPPGVILTTAHAEHAVESFELEAVDYLLKPFSYERFVKSINRFLKLRKLDSLNIQLQPTAKPRPFIFIKAEKKMVKIFLDEILYFEAQRNYLLVTTTNDCLLTYHSITQMEERLPEKIFLRIHRSFIVALDKITGYSSSAVFINKKEIPIGKNYGAEVLAQLRKTTSDSD
jgi:DNA-binding LytR/AlgR family response regulator